MTAKPTYEELEQRIKELENETVERKRAEQALRESEERYRSFIENSSVAMFTINTKGEFTYANKKLVKMTGYNPEEWANKPFNTFLYPEDLNIVMEKIQKRLSGQGSSEPYEIRVYHSSGDILWVKISPESIYERDESGEKRLVGIQCFVQDITSGKVAEQALMESERFLQSVFDGIQDGISVLDRDLNIVKVNSWMEKFYAEQMPLVGKKCYEAYQNKKFPCLRCPSIPAIETAEVHSEVVPYPSAEEPSGWIELSSFPLKDRSGSVVGVIEHVKDVTSKRQAEEALRESEERFRTVADFTHDWEYWIAPDGRYLYVSPSCERITGYGPDEFVNDPGLFEKIVHPDDLSIVVNHLGEEKSLERVPSLDFRIITRSAEVRWMSHVCQAVYGTDGTYLGRRGSNREISKQKLMQEELLKSKKLESLGVLAGGIAHDFNNLMSAVVGNISLAKMEMKPGSKGFKNLVEGEKASIQTKELTARLITFSKGGGPTKETVSISNLVKDSVDSPLKGSDIICRFSIPDDISPAEVDEEQMKQAIRNIITNAQEAMTGQGTIRVSCEDVNIGMKDTLTLQEGKYVKISIEDQGSGIPKENFIRIFDPYFSTKQMGTHKGMGLGLAVSDSIVKQHDGLITVESKLGTGTTLSIYLPALSAESREPSAKPPESHSQSSIVNGQYSIKRVLVMDDEEMVRDVSNALHTYLGYEAEVAVDGVEAIEMYRRGMESGKPYDLVVLDLTNNSGMGGVETIKRLLKIDPDVKAIVATGYSYDPIISNFREHGFRGALTKPFSMDELKTALSEVIAGE